MTQAPGVDPSSATFEEMYQTLQDLVEKLERGNLPLNESLALFEEGMKLVRRCGAMLDDADLTIKTLVQELDRDLSTGEDASRPSSLFDLEDE